MPLTLLVGPANAGKVAALLDRYVAELGRNPFLVVPNRGEVERIERDLLTRVPALLGGRIGTFDDLFEHVLRLAGADGDRPLTRLQRALVLARVVAGARLETLRASARFGGFAASLGEALEELEAGGVDPDELGSELAALYEAFRAELARLGARDRAATRRRAAELAASELAAWDGSPLLIYGFEDLMGAQWALVHALAGRADVCISLPYEPGRPAFQALARTAADLAALAGPRIEERPAQPWYGDAALAHLERTLFDDQLAQPAPLDGGVRFLEAAGTRGALELAGAEILQLLRDGVPAEEIAVVCPSVERLRAPLATAFAELGIPYTVDAGIRFVRTPLGRALCGLLRFAWLEGDRGDLFAFLRSPYSALARSKVDMVEGRLRGRAVTASARVEEEAVRLLGHRIPALDELRAAEEPIAAVAAVGRAMLRAAFGLDRAPRGDAAELDLRAEETLRETLAELDQLAGRAGATPPADLVAALEDVRVPPRLAPSGHVVVLDLLRVRTRRFQAVFVLGLEEGSLPRRAAETPFLEDDLRQELEADGRRRLRRADPVARDRYLFYTACTRPWLRLTLVREAATDDGRPLEASPFWDEVRSRFEPADVERWTRRRPLSSLSWELHRAPTQRERLRAVATLAASDEPGARALAAAGGWERQIDRALAAFERPTALVNPAVLRSLRAQERYSATDLEKFVDCSSMWLVERLLDPKTIDPEVDARLRGIVAHQTLKAFFDGLPRRFGTDTLDLGRLDEAVEYLRECLGEAIESQVRLDLPEVDLLELEGQLARDLELFLRAEVALELPLVPRRFEVGFGTPRSAPELQRGLDLGGFTVSGKIDRVDVDPYSASGLVHDYKSGEAFSARRIESERRLQMPLYVLALRDLLGLEPLGGVYRSLSGERAARGMVRAEAQAQLASLHPQDVLDEEAFWGQVERAAGEARTAVSRIRGGDVGHDPRQGECPSWCRAWPVCRVRRA